MTTYREYKGYTIYHDYRFNEYQVWDEQHRKPYYTEDGKHLSWPQTFNRLKDAKAFIDGEYNYPIIWAKVK